LDSHKRPDPGLTASGEEQGKDLCTSFPHHEKISLILASPLKRTVQTAAHTFGPILRECQVALMLVPAEQEIGAFECDTGQEADALRTQAPEWIREAVPGYGMQQLNLDLIQEGWNRKVCHL
jgi:broad specificity phosphatase PhoE